MVRLRCESTWERLLVPAFVTIWTMVKPTAFTQVRRSYTITVGTLAGLGLLYCAPPLLLARGNRRVRRPPDARRGKRDRRAALAGRHGSWKGRSYAVTGEALASV